MSALSELLKETGDESKDLIRENLLDLIGGAKGESEAVVRETGVKVERWLLLRAQGEIDNDELEALLNARRRAVRQFLVAGVYRAAAR